MKSEPVALDPRLQAYADAIARLEWSALLLDDDWRLVWTSDELNTFMRVNEDSDLGFGLHIAEALLKDTWLAGIHPDSLADVFADVGPYLLYDFQQKNREPGEIMPPEFVGFLEGMEPKELPAVFLTRFVSVDPADRDLPPYPVNVCTLRLNDSDGSVVGWLAIFFMGVRPNLLSLLARGDEQMYERMARLVEPRPRQGAILFCDLHGSGELSRKLPSINYFRLVRGLWTGIDQAVAENTGIVGKHAGDGASAFFLTDDLESPSKTAAAAIRTARRVHEISEEMFRDTLDSDCLMKVGLHWGGSLYMGQLVPGGRLDVTALGDEVNEAARIQEAAGPGETIVSKQLLEQLYPEDAAEVGITLEKVMYRTVAEVAPEAQKVLRDAGGLAITTL